MYDPTGNEVCYSSATTTTNKTFVIDHPVDRDRYLVHACLEGPESGVYYRGKATIVNESVLIALPGYVHKLAYDFTVNVTPIGKPRMCSATEVEPDGTFIMYGDPGVYHWVVYGTRADIETEPFKKDTKVKGDGPYRYI